MLATAQAAQEFGSEGAIAHLLNALVDFIETLGEWIPIYALLDGLDSVLRAAGVPADLVELFVSTLRDLVENIPHVRLIESLLDLLRAGVTIADPETWSDHEAGWEIVRKELHAIWVRLGGEQLAELLEGVARGLIEMIVGDANDGWTKVLDALQGYFKEDIEGLDVGLTLLADSLGLQIVGSISDWLQRDAGETQSDARAPSLERKGAKSTGMKWWMLIALLAVLLRAISAVVPGRDRTPSDRRRDDDDDDRDQEARDEDDDDHRIIPLRPDEIPDPVEVDDFDVRNLDLREIPAGSRQAVEDAVTDIVTGQGRGQHRYDNRGRPRPYLPPENGPYDAYDVTGRRDSRRIVVDRDKRMYFFRDYHRRCDRPSPIHYRA